MARKPIDITGQKFGKLTVLEKSNEKDTDNQIKWKCRCDCGNIAIVRGYNLRNGISKSCGCNRNKDGCSLIGKKFGKLTVLEKVQKKESKKHAFYLCQCDCGNKTIVRSSDLKNGKTLSCGCLVFKHGKTKTRLNYIWSGMKQRCYNKNHDSYKWYGAKGVTVCDEWLNDFQAFYDWAMSHGYDENAPFGECTIDRIDPFGNYEPNNCRWVNMKEQNNNQRKNQ